MICNDGSRGSAGNRAGLKLGLSFFMLVVGAVIYLLTRNEIIFFRWIPDGLMCYFRDIQLPESLKQNYFFAYCLPDGLWYGALLLFQSSFATKSLGSRVLSWISTVLPFVMEFLQIRDDISGTFDSMDLVTNLSVLIILLTTCSSLRKQLFFRP